MKTKFFAKEIFFFNTFLFLSFMNTIVKNILFLSFTLGVWIRLFSGIPASIPIRTALYYSENIGRGASILYSARKVSPPIIRGVRKITPIIADFIHNQLLSGPSQEKFQEWRDQARRLNDAQLQKDLNFDPRLISAQQILNAGYATLNPDEIEVLLTPEGMTFTALLRPNDYFIEFVADSVRNFIPQHYALDPNDFDFRRVPEHLNANTAIPKKIDFSIPFKKLTKEQQRIFLAVNKNSIAYEQLLKAGFGENITLSEEFKGVKINNRGEIIGTY